MRAAFAGAAVYSVAIAAAGAAGEYCADMHVWSSSKRSCGTCMPTMAISRGLVLRGIDGAALN